jgi:hypothetical protein
MGTAVDRSPRAGDSAVWAGTTQVVQFCTEGWVHLCQWGWHCLGAPPHTHYEVATFLLVWRSEHERFEPLWARWPRPKPRE